MRKKKLCISVRRERKTEQPPRLFDLTGLQREGNRIYGYTAKQTLDLAQALYEKRLLTYPRTDSNYLTDDMGDTAVHIAALLVGKLPFMKGAAFTPDISKCERKTMGSLHRRRFILSQERLSVGAVGQYCEGNRKEVYTIGAA